ncbi:MAG TPA: pseudouridine synthase [Mucilaginibacter sp.]|nr:pseudouridine synthase [Mucilaginibacter sp.]
MAFNRPQNGREDKSGRPSSRTSKTGEGYKRNPSSRQNPNSETGKSPAVRPSKKYYDNKTDGRGPSVSSGNRPYSNKNRRVGKPGDSFDNQNEDRKSFPQRSRKPYSKDGNNRDGKAPVKARSYSTREGNSRPWSEKKSGGDRPAFKKDSNYKKPFETGRAKRENYQSDQTPPENTAPAKTLRGRKKAAEETDNGLIRLNRYISNAGICSRRKADELISAGVVSVNGNVVSELGYKVDPHKDQIRYNGELLKREKMVYVLLNKPKDYITTTDDPQERRTVMHLVEKASKERIYPVGRLDRNTTGLLLMTNDGDLADKLSHPRNNIVKLYQVELSKSLTQGDMNKIAFGLELEDGLIKPDSVSYVAGGSKREIGIQIHSGKNRIVRRIFEHLGYEVVKLDRVVYANLTKKDLPRGRWRLLEEKEIIQLKHLV